MHTLAIALAWSFVGILLYGALVAAVWPTARPVVPLAPLLLAVLFPPALPFLVIYVLVLARPATVVVDRVLAVPTPVAQVVPFHTTEAWRGSASV